MQLHPTRRDFSGGIAIPAEESTEHGFPQELMAADARTALDER